MTWVGSSANAEDRRIAGTSGIDLPGRVPDILPIVGAARCYVVPLRVGGGTRLKVLDAWSMGRAVVSTNVGCEGLAAVSGANALLADDPEGFANAVCDVLDDDDLARRLGRAGRRTVETEYSWEVIHPGMVEEYRRCIGSDAPGRATESRAGS
jgi:glycosyltransferase involved in cell wall biosynthesis